MKNLIYKLNRTHALIKLFFLVFIIYLAVDSLLPYGFGITSIYLWIKFFVMTIVLFISIGFYIPELIHDKDKKRDL